MLKKLLFGDQSFNVESDSYMRALREYKKLSEQDFNNVQKRLGLDGATSFSHLYFSGTDQMQRFKKELELHHLEYSLDNNNYEVLVVVPDEKLGMSQRNDKLVDQVTKHSLGCGFLEVSRVDLTLSSAIEGARQLAKMIKNRKSQKKLILVSFSHSSASVRIMLDQMDSLNLGKIKGWVNISGLIFGSPLYFCSQKKPGIFNRNNEVMRSYSSEQKYFLRPMRHLPFKTIHFIGAKLSSQMGIAEKRRYGFLKPWGPNDGLIAFSSYQRVKEPVVSVLNEGHCINVDNISLTFKRSLCSLVGLVPRSANISQWIHDSVSKQSVDGDISESNH